MNGVNILLGLINILHREIVIFSDLNIECMVILFAAVHIDNKLSLQ